MPKFDYKLWRFGIRKEHRNALSLTFNIEGKRTHWRRIWKGLFYRTQS